MLQRLHDAMRRLLCLVTRLFRGSSGNPGTVRETIIPRDQHPVSRNHLSKAALNTLYGLHKGGYQAYLVGGCLRDLLTGGEPKDFDVVTDATPEEIEHLFRRARIIGRRFRLVHVRFGPEVIEVSTFRARPPESPATGRDRRSLSDDGQVLRDNIYGNIQEDALRRDFTINALYYNIADFALHDFTDSMKDLEAGIIRLIGDPEQRYREDPVRMLRAARFAAKLGFDLHPDTEAPIGELSGLLRNVPPARLFDEILKLFLSGHAGKSLDALRRLGLFEPLFPETAAALAAGDESGERLLAEAMRNTDRRISQNKPVTPAFLFGVLLWPAVRARMAERRDAGEPPMPALNQAMGEVLAREVEIVAIPRRFSSVMREIWSLQMRLPRRTGKRAEALLGHRRFRAAYDFLLVRERAGEIEPGLGDWWTRYQEADEDERAAMVQELGRNEGGDGKPRKRRRRRRPRKREVTGE